MILNESKAKKCTALIDSIRKTLECSICLELFSDPVSVGCGHFFCRTCIAAVLKTKVRAPCPICTKFFTRRYVQEASQRQLIVGAARDLVTCIKKFANNKGDKVSDSSVEQTAVPPSMSNPKKKDGKRKNLPTNNEKDLSVITIDPSQEATSVAKKDEIQSAKNNSVQTNFYDRIQKSTKNTFTEDSEDFVKVHNDKNSGIPKLTKRARRSIEPDNNCIVPTKRCVIGKEEKQQSPPRDKKEIDEEDPYTFIQSEDDGMVKNSNKRRKKNKVKALIADEKLTSKQNSKSLSTESHKKKRTLDDVSPADDEKGGVSKKNRGIINWLSNSKKDNQNCQKVQDRPSEQIETTLSVVSLPVTQQHLQETSVSCSKIISKAQKVRNSKRVIRKKELDNASEIANSVNESASVVKEKKLRSRKSKTEVVMNDDDNDCIEIENVVKRAEKNIDSLLVHTESLNSCQKIVDNKDLLLQECIIEKADNTDNEEIEDKENQHSSPTYKKNTSDVSLPGGNSEHQVPNDDESLSKSSGWSRIRQMNKDFHLRKFPLLHVQKNKTLHSPGIPMNDSVEENRSPMKEITQNEEQPILKELSIVIPRVEIPFQNDSSPQTEGNSTDINYVDINPKHLNGASKDSPFHHQKGNDLTTHDDKSSLITMDTAPFCVNSIVSQEDMSGSPKPLCETAPFDVVSDMDIEPVEQKREQMDHSGSKAVENFQTESNFSKISDKLGNKFAYTHNKILSSHKYIPLKKEISVLASLKHKGRDDCIRSLNQTIKTPEKHPIFSREASSRRSSVSLHSDISEQRCNSFVSDRTLEFAKKEKIVKRVCLTFDEICSYFNESNITGKIETICTVPLPFSDFKLQLTVAEEVLNVSVLKTLQNYVSESTPISENRAFQVSKTECNNVPTKEYKNAETQFSGFDFVVDTETKDNNVLNSSFDSLPETQLRVLNDDEKQFELSTEIHLDTSTPIRSKHALEHSSVVQIVNDNCNSANKEAMDINIAEKVTKESVEKKQSSSLSFESDSVFNYPCIGDNKFCMLSPTETDIHQEKSGHTMNSKNSDEALEKLCENSPDPASKDINVQKSQTEHMINGNHKNTSLDTEQTVDCTVISNSTSFTEDAKLKNQFVSEKEKSDANSKTNVNTSVAKYINETRNVNDTKPSHRSSKDINCTIEFKEEGKSNVSNGGKGISSEPEVIDECEIYHLSHEKLLSNSSRNSVRNSFACEAEGLNIGTCKNDSLGLKNVNECETASKKPCISNVQNSCFLRSPENKLKKPNNNDSYEVFTTDNDSYNPKNGSKNCKANSVCKDMTYLDKNKASKQKNTLEKVNIFGSLSPGESPYLSENFDPFADQMDFIENTPIRSTGDVEFDEIVKESETFSSDPDMIFATNLVAPLKSIAERDKQNKMLQQVVKRTDKNMNEEEEADDSLKQPIGKINGDLSKLSQSNKKFKRISSYSFSESSDSEDFEVNESLLKERNENEPKGVEVLSDMEDDNVESRGIQTLDNTQALARVYANVEADLKLGQNLHETSNSRLPVEAPDAETTFEAVSTCDIDACESASKLEQDILEMKERMKLLREKLNQEDSQEDEEEELEKFEVAGEDCVENNEMQKSQGSNDMFSEQIPPTPPKSKSKVAKRSNFATSIYKRN